VKTIQTLRSDRTRTKDTQQHAKIAISYVLKVTLVGLFLVAALSTTGCWGLVTRGLETGGKYGELINTLEPPSSDSGRLFVYLTEGGPNPWNTLGAADFCTVDRKVFPVLGATFWFVDLPEGRHQVTADGVGGWKAHFGKHRVEFDLRPGETKYCRISLRWFRAYTPVMVDPSDAINELRSLHYHEFKWSKVTVED